MTDDVRHLFLPDFLKDVGAIASKNNDCLCDQSACLVYGCQQLLNVPTMRIGGLDDHTYQTAFAVFTDYTTERKAPRWIHWGTSPGFRHCIAIIPAGGQTAVVNSLANGMSVAFAPFSPYACAIACVRAGHRVLSFTFKPSSEYAEFGWHSCVSVTKALLGVRKWWIISPRQLYEHLIRSGAQEVRDNVTKQLSP